VIIASEASKGLAESAVEKAKRIASPGLNIGVLRSNDYASLRPGYWVAFAGQFDSVEEAQQAAARYQRQFPSAYQRFIEQG
jgi:predicted trehalose synthase